MNSEAPITRAPELTNGQIAKDRVALSELLYAAEWDEAASFVTANPHTACGLNTKTKTFMGGTPFLVTAIDSQSTSVVRAFVEAGAPLEIRDKTGRTPLFAALSMISYTRIRSSWHEMVDYLFEQGCRADVLNDECNSILAATNCDLPPKITQKLLEGGSRVDLFDKGTNFHSITRMVKATVDSGDANRLENLKLIVSSGVDLNPMVNNIESSPLGSTLWGGESKVGKFSSLDLADFLVQHGANPLHRAVNGESVLFAALDKDSVNWVVSRYPELLESRNLRGQTPLLAQTLSFLYPKKTGEGTFESVMALIAAGADLDVVDHQGSMACKTPRMLIAGSRNEETLKNFVASITAATAARKAIGEVDTEPSVKAHSP